MRYTFYLSAAAHHGVFTLSLHDALPIFALERPPASSFLPIWLEYFPGYRNSRRPHCIRGKVLDRKSTRLNSSHANISYAAFCLKKKNIWLRLAPHLHSACTRVATPDTAS